MVIELLWGRSLRWRYQWKKLSQSLWHDSTSQYSGCYLRPKAILLRRVWAECYPNGLAKKDLKIWNEDSAENTHILWMGKNHSLYSRPPVWLVWIQVLCLCLINNICNCLAESKPVKQKVSRSVSDTSPPPTKDVSFLRTWPTNDNTNSIYQISSSRFRWPCWPLYWIEFLECGWARLLLHPTLCPAHLQKEETGA